MQVNIGTTYNNLAEDRKIKHFSELPINLIVELKHLVKNLNIQSFKISGSYYRGTYHNENTDGFFIQVKQNFYKKIGKVMKEESDLDIVLDNAKRIKKVGNINIMPPYMPGIDVNVFELLNYKT